jgi:hypothetical protein
VKIKTTKYYTLTIDRTELETLRYALNTAKDATRLSSPHSWMRETRNGRTRFDKLLDDLKALELRNSRCGKIETTEDEAEAVATELKYANSQVDQVRILLNAARRRTRN